MAAILGLQYVNFRGNNDPEIENPPEGRALKKTKTAKAMT
jgi:hypothetical protein